MPLGCSTYMGACRFLYRSDSGHDLLDLSKGGLSDLLARNLAETTEMAVGGRSGEKLLRDSRGRDEDSFRGSAGSHSATRSMG
ncbi:hypothetical protein ARSEF4850_006086 [Beauveria asiatica]